MNIIIIIRNIIFYYDYAFYNLLSSLFLHIQQGGGGTGVFLSIPRENGQRLILKNYFLLFLSNGKIVYYQDVFAINTLIIQIFGNTNFSNFTAAKFTK